jgi:hypothetical protein
VQTPLKRGDVAPVVELCDAMVAKSKAKDPDIGFKLDVTRMLTLMCSKCTRQPQKLPVPFDVRMAASCIAAAVRRGAIDARRQRLTLRQTRRRRPSCFNDVVRSNERRGDDARPGPVRAQHRQGGHHPGDAALAVTKIVCDDIRPLPASRTSWSADAAHRAGRRCKPRIRRPSFPPRRSWWSAALASIGLPHPPPGHRAAERSRTSRAG